MVVHEKQVVRIVQYGQDVLGQENCVSRDVLDVPDIREEVSCSRR